MRSYATINENLSKHKGIDSLLASYKKDIQAHIAEGYQAVVWAVTIYGSFAGNLLNWESYKIDTYVAKMAEFVSIYEERVEELLNIADKIDMDLAALDTCQYSAVTVGGLLESIQANVDQLSLGNYSNLAQWVDKLDQAVSFISYAIFCE